ncbi:MAG: FHA domain-containing protein [Planctomycetia bacterium]
MSMDDLSPSVTRAAPPAAWPAAWYWWIDAVGGFLVLRRPVVRIGHAGDPANDLPLMADLSAHHAELWTDALGTRLRAVASVKVNGRAVEEKLLKDQDRITLRGVELQYHRPCPWSGTGRLELKSAHRLPLSLDGVILLGETCLAGRGTESHIRAGWDGRVAVHWYQDRYWLRAPGPLEIDGKTYADHGPLTPNADAAGPWGRFRWEPLATSRT